MAASTSTSSVYFQVIEDVINKVRDKFDDNNGGPGENVLIQLQGLWESKMVTAAANLAPIDGSSAPVDDLNGVPYYEDGGEEYETFTADLLFPPTPLQNPLMQTPPPRDYSDDIPEMKARTEDFLLMGKRKREDLSADAVVGDVKQEFVIEEPEDLSRRRISQLDGGNIYNYQGGVNVEEVATGAVMAENEVGEDEDEEVLNENDDEDVEVGEEELKKTEEQHLVLGQFDKVSRNKSRWKCNLKDGIMHINNRDILFNKADGEFDF